MNRLIRNLTVLAISCIVVTGYAQDVVNEQHTRNEDNLPVHEYSITIKKEKVNKAGKEMTGIY